MAFVVTPVLLNLFAVISIKVLPAFQQISASMPCRNRAVWFFLPPTACFGAMLAAPVLFLWFAAFLYVTGPRAETWFPVLQRVRFRLPWQLKRMQRDFSVMLAILLDAGMPEPGSRQPRGRLHANNIFRMRATQAVDGLEARNEVERKPYKPWTTPGNFAGGSPTCHAMAVSESVGRLHEAADQRRFSRNSRATRVTTALVLLNGSVLGFGRHHGFFGARAIVTPECYGESFA